MWINGHSIGHHESGYTSAHYDITDVVHFGGRNEVAVRVDATGHEGWWYEGGGIYRQVWLTKVSPVHVVPYGVYVTSQVPDPRDGSTAQASTQAEVSVENSGITPVQCVVRSEIQDATGAVVGSAETPGSVEAGRTATVHYSIPLASASLWSCDHPYIYKLVTTVLEDGRPVDCVRTPFGIRTIRFDADRGFFLNGRPVKIKGGTLSFGPLTTATLGGLSGAQALPSNSLTSLTLNTQPSVSSTYTAVLTNSGATLGLTVTGSGTQTLSASETYTGPTAVSASSTLIVTGSISGTTVVVANGATLISGSNTTADLGGASPPVSVYGTLDVGGTANSVGELTTGPQTLETTGTMATLAMELGGTSAGAYDQIQVTPSSALNLANVTLQLSLIDGYTPTNGDLLFLIVGAGSETGTFANQVGGQILIGSQQFNVSYDASFSGDSFTGGNDVALQAVPEPDTWMMLLGGIGVLTFWRRSRRLRPPDHL